MGRTSDLDVQVRGYLDGPIAGQEWTGYGKWRATKEKPIGGLLLFDVANRARDSGHPITLVLEGPDALEAGKRFEELLETPASLGEARELGPLWFSRLGWAEPYRGEEDWTW